VLQPVDGNIGQLIFHIVIHQVFIPVFRIGFCAGPAAEINLCSGASDIELSPAGEAPFFYLHHRFLSFIFYGLADKIRPNRKKVKTNRHSSQEP
jgi:hypothetical protein